MGKKKNLKYVVLLLLIAVTAAVMAFATACENGGENGGGDNSGVTETLKHTVTIVGTKTQQVKVEDGATAESYKPTTNPKKSGCNFAGWYKDGSETEYDWKSPVKANTTIRAKFVPIEGLTVVHGTAFPIADGGLVTGSENTMFLTGEFEKGSFSVNVTPVSANDCGVVFGAAKTAETIWWENNTYYTLLINRDGNLLLAKIDPAAVPVFNVVAESSVSDYSASETYQITVKYSGNEAGLTQVLVNGETLINTKLGELPGTGVGCRAQYVNTEFGKMTFDENDLPEAPQAVVINGFTVRNGGLNASGDNKVVTSKERTLALLGEVKDGNNLISVKMNGAHTSDNGIVFMLSDNSNVSYWEEDDASYYFFFMTGSNVRLAAVKKEGNTKWHSIFEKNVAGLNPSDSHTYTVYYDAEKIYCFIDGTLYITADNTLNLTGASYGIRAGAVGVEYERDDTQGKFALIVDNGSDTVLTLVNSGETVNKPQDPVKLGYVFEGWFVGDEEFSWGAVTDNTVVKAKFRENAELSYTVPFGSAELTDGKFKTNSANTFIALKQTFGGGSAEAKVIPSTANDCGIVFGVDTQALAANPSGWETFDYFTVLINVNGTILFAKVNNWAVIASSAVLEPGFDPANEYTLKVLYADGYCRIYANGQLAITAYIGNLSGTGIGFRAQAANTEFSENFTVNSQETVEIVAQSQDAGSFTERNGVAVNADNGVYTTAGNDTLATSSTKLTNGGTISVKMTIGNISGDRCNGIIFGLSENAADKFWENGESYYFFFIDTAGSVRLTGVNTGGTVWNEYNNKLTTANVNIAEEHTLTVSYDGNGVICYVDGIMYFATDAIKLNGSCFGIRAQDSGVIYKDFEVKNFIA